MNIVEMYRIIMLDLPKKIYRVTLDPNLSYVKDLPSKFLRINLMRNISDVSQSDGRGMFLSPRRIQSAQQVKPLALCDVA
jgi:hypothetical protein